MNSSSENKIWGALFLIIPIACVALFVVAPMGGEGMGKNWWFPKDISTFGHEIDGLFYMILGITGVAFIITEALLALAIFRFGSPSDTRPKATYLHGSHKVELAWTILPAAILLLIALTQMDIWKRVKFVNHFPTKVVHARVEAGQFEWRITYPGADGKLGTRDDVHAVNHLHVPANTDVLIELRSRDVLHSFFLPNLRLKQDAVPGMTIPVWFNAKESGEYELMCAELCGWGHYKMKGWLTVHKDAADFNAWLASEKTKEEAWTER